MVPNEERNPVTVSLESFFNDCKRGNMNPKANYNIGLEDSISVILANKAMDEERRVQFSELETMGKGSPAAPGAKKKATHT
jgi:hypothetical protein